MFFIQDPCPPRSWSIRFDYCLGQIRKDKPYLCAVTDPFYFKNQLLYANVPIVGQECIFTWNSKYFTIEDRHTKYKSIGAAIDALTYVRIMRSSGAYRELHTHVLESCALQTKCYQMSNKFYKEIAAQLAAGFELCWKARIDHIQHVNQRAQKIINRFDNWLKKQIIQQYCHTDHTTRDIALKSFAQKLDEYRMNLQCKN